MNNRQLLGRYTRAVNGRDGRELDESDAGSELDRVGLGHAVPAPNR